MHMYLVEVHQSLRQHQTKSYTTVSLLSIKLMTVNLNINHIIPIVGMGQWHFFDATVAF